MLDFTSLPAEPRYALCGLVFLAVFAQFAYLIYRAIVTEKLRRCIPDAVLFLLLMLFGAYLSGASSAGSVLYPVLLPYGVPVLLSVAVVLISSARAVTEYRRNRHRLTPASVQQALDNLNSGICFSDESGRIILMNRVMARLALSRLNTYPQLISELNDALGKDAIFTSSDGTFWQLSSAPLKAPALKGFTQTTAVEVTELVLANQAIERQTQALKETNAEMQGLLERLADRIREQETLELKTQIHNDIGTSLIQLMQLLNGERKGETDALAVLENAVSYFSRNRVVPRNSTLDAARRKAEALGVSLILLNPLKLDAEASSLFAEACDICITNCINHANGNKLFVELSENGEHVSARFTNNGSPPDGEICEGGGLSSLRRKTEQAGGMMRVSSSPEFSLLITLPKGEKSLD